MHHVSPWSGMLPRGLAAATAHAAEMQVAAAAETHEQRCQRWADLGQVPAKDRDRYIKDGVLDLKIPDPQADRPGTFHARPVRWRGPLVRARA